jgi:hypothetical protein
MLYNNNIAIQNYIFSFTFYDTVRYILRRRMLYFQWRTPMPAFLPCLLFVLLIGGCSSRIPEPIAYPYTQQQKMQASHHWQVLAEDLAKRLNKELILSDNISKAVYVKETCGNESKPCDPSESSSFNEAFRDLLITNLVGFGIPTQQQKDEECLDILYKVQVVRHNSDRIRTLQPGILTSLSAAIVVLRNAPSELITLALGAAADVANSNMTVNGHYEIIITTSMLSSGKYIFRASDIYYINDKDFWHYQGNPVQAKTIQLTSSTSFTPKEPVKPLPRTYRPAPENTEQPTPADKKEI